MGKYPIHVEEEIAAFQKRSKNTDDTTKTLLTLVFRSENEAYEQGLKDGFAGPYFKNQVTTEPAAEQDPKLNELVCEIREIVMDEFEEHGFETMMKALGPAPEEATWGEKIYEMMQEAYIQGFFLGFKRQNENEGTPEGHERNLREKEAADKDAA